jgi:hypothetical protein
LAKNSAQEPKKTNNPPNNGVGGFKMPGLNLENIKSKDFQEEFMDKFDEYSKSWRDMIEKQKRF